MREIIELCETNIEKSFWEREKAKAHLKMNLSKKETKETISEIYELTGKIKALTQVLILAKKII